MPTCGACGRESPDGFAFCPACGAPLGARPAPERRKLATLVFCDVSGSTALGERVDAESVRELMFRYFHSMRDALERHGGTVEKFVGDAVLAVFGVPVAHEDDALRAVRAAWEMQERMGVLNEELERRLGVRIALRIGVHTGEVVAGDASSRETFVTGDAVNTAARLEQAAQPGEVLVGEPTFRLVRDAVMVEPVDAVAARGKAEPVPAYRLLGVAAGAAGRERRLEAELVGRERELELLLDAWRSVRTLGGCRLVTLVGEPGVGKSRLARELLERAPGAHVLTGRCLPYGEGITWWPLAEIVREAAAIRDEHGRDEARERVLALVEDDPDGIAVAAAVGRAVGVDEGAATAEEVAWAFRRLLAALARRRPVIVVVDDLQWAEAPLLDLLGQLAEAVDDGPLLALCLGRPELLERSFDPPGVIALEPLTQAAAKIHARALVAGADLPSEVADRVLATAGGNPFFAEELVAMLRDDPLAAMPATVHQLLGERLDRLPDSERESLECGAVEGEAFHRGAAAALAGRPVDEDLSRLAERAFVRPAQARFVDEAAFSFRHLLVRDAAYRATAKRVRARLHERFADWLERAAADRLQEFEEILGYHLEQAHRYLAELGPAEPSLAARAARHLAAAGRRAAERGEAPAAASLLGRAADLLDHDDPDRLEILLDRSIALAKAGDMAAAEPGLLEVARKAERLGRPGLGVLAAVEREFARLFAADLGVEIEAFAARAEEAAAELDRLGDRGGAARALARATAAWTQAGRLSRAERAGRRALELMPALGGDRDRADVLEWLSLALYDGPTPPSEYEEITAEVVRRSGESRSFAWFGRLFDAVARGPTGELELARARVREGKQIAIELGLQVNAACTSLQLAHAELLGGELLESEAELRAAVPALERFGALNPLASVAAYLGLVVQARGDSEEAERWLARARELASPEDAEVEIFVPASRARAAVARGDADAAVAFGRQALAAADGVERVLLRTEALTAHADALECAGRGGEARAYLQEAFELYERKGYAVAAERTRARLEATAPARD
ncbi:MAG TPA: AAA family ATPase [Gaiellaceae bacterium]|nr:AAA family ATPase [Gaiellaceae bacterium]